MTTDMLGKIQMICQNKSCLKRLDFRIAPIKAFITLGTVRNQYIYCSEECYKQVIKRFKENVDNKPERGLYRITIESEQETSPGVYEVKLKSEIIVKGIK